MSNPSDIRVTMKMPCARKKKTFDVELSLEEAKTFDERQKTKVHAAEQIKTALEQLGDKIPDLVIAFRGRAFILANVHDSNDSSIGRSINDILQEDVFAVRERGPRAPKAPGAEVPPVTE